jgi:hypothetical protein
VDETGSRSYPLVVSGINGVELLGYATRELVTAIT